MKTFFGGSLTVAPKGRNSDGTYEVSSISGAKRIWSEGILSYPDLYNVPDWYFHCLRKSEKSEEKF